MKLKNFYDYFTSEEASEAKPIKSIEKVRSQIQFRRHSKKLNNKERGEGNEDKRKIWGFGCLNIGPA